MPIQLRGFISLLLFLTWSLPGFSLSPAVHSQTSPSSKQSATVPLAAPVGTRQNWPCPGCITNIPSTYQPGKPISILVALHGDEGNPSSIFSTWVPATTRKNMILFTPKCPTVLGCRLPNGNGTFTNSWWGWYQSGKYVDAWLGNQVNLIQAQYSIDTTHEFLAGWSGGADFLGYYALAHASRFSRANFTAGGTPYYQSCPSTKIAAYFLMGSNDFRYLSGQPTQVKQVLDRCGSLTNLVVLPGADHQATMNALTTQGYSDIILCWFLNPSGQTC